MRSEAVLLLSIVLFSGKVYLTNPQTVAPLMLIGTTSLLAISTLTSEINFYTRLIRLKDPDNACPMFTVLQVQLACEACKENGKSSECVHLLHLVI